MIQIRASRSSETAFSDIYLFIFIKNIWAILRQSNLISCVLCGETVKRMEIHIINSIQKAKQL